MSIRMEYNPRIIEKKWQKYWADNQTYKVSNDSDKPKYYVLDMFPYPSGAGLHVGHPLGYIASDIFSRYKRLKGFNVLHPMGYDAFGLPAEQYAIQTGVHPAISTAENIKRYKEQLDNIGFSFDWDREVQTSDPNFYKWTQWIFIQLFEHYYDNEKNIAVPIADLVATFSSKGTTGLNVACSEEMNFSADDWNGMSKKEQSDVLMNYRLAYRKVTFVNWCDELGTVLANDEVKDGLSERGGFPVERKPMMQWSLRITAYADRLLNDLHDVDWSDSMKRMQSNWIGKSEGAQLFFDIKGKDAQIEIYTTRIDTIFGATYMVLAPEHDLVKELTTDDQKENVEKYIDYVASRSERDRQAESKDVTGVFTGAFAINPFNGKEVPIWLGEYVLKDYGTGAIMAVPSDDERDKRFAEKYGLEIIDVIDKSDFPNSKLSDKEGVMINSDFLTGMQVPDAIALALKKVEELKIGTRKVNFRLRDAIFSRQRYWGEPFPIVYDENDIPHVVPFDELPVQLPELSDFKPTSGGKSPLARKEDWVNLPNGWRRETDTMPGFAGSSWYYLRYMDADNKDEFASQDAIKYWKSVDLYVGGTEHAIGHLMYSRFWNKFLFDKGLVVEKEPFKKLINQGMIQGIIESMYMFKEKQDGVTKFVCAKKVEKMGLDKEVVAIPVLVDFIQEYGTEHSYMNIDSIKRFMDWRPEYSNAIFDCEQGVFQNGTFTPYEDATDSHLFTHSEVGKMSKSKFNVVNPDDVVEKYGTDTFRMYEMFLGPVEQSKPWNTNSIGGVSRFLRKYWSLFYDESGKYLVVEESATKAENKILHTCIKKIQEDIERFSFNTCVSAFMEAVNDLKKVNCSKREVLEQLNVLLAPFAPHIAEEIWNILGHDESVTKATFPTFDASFLQEDSFEYPICINGKKRAMASFDVNASKDDIEKAALGIDIIQKWTEGKTIRKVIVVPKRMVNIVVG